MPIVRSSLTENLTPQQVLTSGLRPFEYRDFVRQADPISPPAPTPTPELPPEAAPIPAPYEPPTYLSTINLAGDPGQAYNEIVRLIGRQLTGNELEILKTRIGYTGGNITPEMAQAIMKEITPYIQRKFTGLDPNAINAELTSLMGRPLNSAEISKLASLIGLGSDDPITNEQRGYALDLANRYKLGQPLGYDANIVQNEIVNLIGRQLTQSEIGKLASDIGYTGGLVTHAQRGRALELAKQLTQSPVNLDPNAINNEITAMMGRSLTPTEMQQLIQGVGIQPGQAITAQHRTDALNMVRQYMQGLPITSPITPSPSPAPNLAAPAVSTPTTSSPTATNTTPTPVPTPAPEPSQLNPRRFDFGTNSPF